MLTFGNILMSVFRMGLIPICRTAIIPREGFEKFWRHYDDRFHLNREEAGKSVAVLFVRSFGQASVVLIISYTVSVKDGLPLDSKNLVK